MDNSRHRRAVGGVGKKYAVWCTRTTKWGLQEQREQVQEQRRRVQLALLLVAFLAVYLLLSDMKKNMSSGSTSALVCFLPPFPYDLTVDRFLATFLFSLSSPSFL